MIKFVEISPYQSIYDLAVQHYGSAEGVGLLLELNPDLNFDETPTVFSIIKIDQDKIINKSIVDYFERNEIVIATSSDDLVVPPAPVAPPNTKPLSIKIFIDENTFDFRTIIVDADMVGEIDTISQDGSSGSITVLKNGSPVSAPITFELGDSIAPSRSIASADGHIIFSGTYE